MTGNQHSENSRDRAPQRGNSNRQEIPTVRPNNLTRHYFRQISDFRMGNWDRSECVLDAVMEDLRIRKAELDSRSAVISLNKLRENSKNADNSEDSSEENLKIEDYIREVQEVQLEMDNFKKCFELNRQQTQTNIGKERTFVEAWIELEQKRQPLIAKRSIAKLTNNTKALEEYNAEMETIFKEFSQHANLPIAFVREQLSKLSES